MNNRNFIEQTERKLQLTMPFMTKELIKSRAQEEWEKFQRKQIAKNVVNNNTMKTAPLQNRLCVISSFREKLNTLSSDFETQKPNSDAMFDMVYNLRPKARRTTNDVYNFDEESDEIPSTLPPLMSNVGKTRKNIQKTPKTTRKLKAKNQTSPKKQTRNRVRFEDNEKTRYVPIKTVAEVSTSRRQVAKRMDKFVLSPQNDETSPKKRYEPSKTFTEPAKRIKRMDKFVLSPKNDGKTPNKRYVPMKTFTEASTSRKQLTKRMDRSVLSPLNDEKTKENRYEPIGTFMEPINQLDKFVLLQQNDEKSPKKKYEPSKQSKRMDRFVLTPQNVEKTKENRYEPIETFMEPINQLDKFVLSPQNDEKTKENRYVPTKTFTQPSKRMNQSPQNDQIIPETQFNIDINEEQIESPTKSKNLTEKRVDIVAENEENSFSDINSNFMNEDVVEKEKYMKPLTFAIEKLTEKLNMPNSAMMNMGGRSNNIYWQITITNQTPTNLQETKWSTNKERKYIEKNELSEIYVEENNFSSLLIEKNSFFEEKTENNEGNDVISECGGQLEDPFRVIGEKLDNLDVLGAKILAKMHRFWVKTEKIFEEIDSLHYGLSFGRRRKRAAKIRPKIKLLFLNEVLYMVIERKDEHPINNHSTLSDLFDDAETNTDPLTHPLDNRTLLTLPDVHSIEDFFDHSDIFVYR
uniref:Uncharacterized protein n=1 Tax=Strigamia maritima TaxID=126957 RepID=T1IN56_STRMM